MASYFPIPAAGRARLPAAIVHPDDVLPANWPVAESWAYRGQHGAWLVRALAGVPLKPNAGHTRGPGRSWYEACDGDAVQIVYHATAPHRRPAHIGSAIGHALRDGYTCDLRFYQ